MSGTFIPLDPIWRLMISLIAGTLITAAGMPKLYARYVAYRRKSARYERADIWRDTLVGIGNALWVVFGIATGHLALILFCGIQVLLMAALVILNFRSPKTENPRLAQPAIELHNP
jgi:hypothetical protein